MNNAAFTWKCGAHNAIVPVRRQCPECITLQRDRLHAAGVCHAEGATYESMEAQRRRELRVAAKSPSFSIPQCWTPQTVTGIPTEQSRIQKEIEDRKLLELIQFRGSSPGIRAMQERSAEALLNFIEHSSAALKQEHARIETQLDSRARKALLSFDVLFHTFEAFVEQSVRCFRGTMRRESGGNDDLKFGLAVRRHCTVRLIQEYAASTRVGK